MRFDTNILPASHVSEAAHEVFSTVQTPDRAAFIAPNGDLLGPLSDSHAHYAHEIFREASDAHDDNEGCEQDLNDDAYAECVAAGRNQDLDDLMSNYGYIRIADDHLGLDGLAVPTEAQLRTVTEYPEFERLRYLDGPAKFTNPIRRAMRLAMRDVTI